MRILPLILFLGGVTALLSAPKQLTVEQLKQSIASFQARGFGDVEVARAIANFQLTERLTGAELASLYRTLGPETKNALDILADESTWLDVPRSEWLSEAPPAFREQNAIIATTGDYALNYIHKLPDFLCTEVTRRFDDDASHRHVGSERWRYLRLYDEITSALTFSQGKESNVIQTVNGKAYDRGRQIGGVMVRGEFGGAIAALFLGNSNAKVKWSHWEMAAGQRVAVFQYGVAKEHSHYTLSYCCEPITNREGRSVPLDITVAYTGELSIEPGSGAILRMTEEAANVPYDFPTREGRVAIEYKPVRIGAATYLCPVKSITSSEGRSGDTTQTLTPMVQSINEVQFIEYRKFGAESTLVAGSANAQASTSFSNPIAPAAITTGPRVSEVTAPPVLESSSAPPSSSLLSVWSLPLPPSPPLTTDNAARTTPASAQTKKQPSVLFREHLNVVPVRVVVRDRKGRAVGDLQKNDFELFDQNKRQVISGFSVERAASGQGEPALAQGQSTAEVRAPGSEAGSVPLRPVTPDRYVALFVDDLHLAFGDLSQTRAAADRALNGTLDPRTRFGLFSASGRYRLPFTEDRAKLEGLLKTVAPYSQSGGANLGCPEVSYYVADRIVNYDDQAAWDLVAAEEMYRCGAPREQARSMALIAAKQSLGQNGALTRTALLSLADLIRSEAPLPGQRTIVLISPGFNLSVSSLNDLNRIIDWALRAGVVVNTFDARGLYVPAGFDVDTEAVPNRPDLPTKDVAPVRPNPSPMPLQVQQGQYERDAQRSQSDALLQLADGTGGSAFQNSNDFDAGFQRVLAAPAVSYVLEFTPPDLKPDSSYHRLKVTVKGRKGLKAEARRGYFAESGIKQAKAD